MEYASISNCKGDTFIRTRMRMIARANDRYLFYCMVENLTAQHEAEQRAFETSERLQAIMDNVGSGITALTLYGDRAAYLFVNDAYYEILGYTRRQYADEVLDFFDVIHPDDRQTALRRARDVNWTGETQSIEYRALRRDGREIWLRTIVSLMRFTGVEDAVQLGITRDITDERLARTRILNTSVQLEAILNNVHGGVSAATLEDGEIRYVFVNDEYYQLFGYTREQFHQELPHALIDLIDPDDLPAVVRSAEECVRTGQPVQIEFRARTRGGDVVWIRSNSSVCGILGVDAPVHIAVLSDVTAEKRSARMLAESAERIRSLNADLMMLMNDMPGGFARLSVGADGSLSARYVNNSLLTLLGVEDSAALQTGDMLLGVYPEDREKAREALLRATTTGEQLNIKCRFISRRSGYRWMNVFGRVTASDSGERFLNLYFADLTDQERREESIRDMLPIALSAMMESSTDLSFVKDKELRYVCSSRAFAKRAGLADEKRIAGKTDYDLFDRQLAEKYRADDQRLMESGQSLVDYIERLPDENGEFRYSKTSKYLLHDVFGAVVGLYGVGRDITESREASEKLQLLMDSIAGGLATYACTPDSIRLLSFNDNLCALFGYTRPEYERHAATNPTGLVNTDDLPSLLAQLHRLRDDGTPIDCIFNTATKQGARKTLHMRAVPSERNGDAVTLHAVLYDVTNAARGLRPLDS